MSTKSNDPERLIPNTTRKTIQERKPQRKQRIFNPLQKEGIFSIFPNILKTKLPYSQDFGLSTGTLSSVFGPEQSFRLNAPFDPDFTGTGHQPYGYDQLTPFYNKCMVTAVDIEVTFYDPSADGLACGIFMKSYLDATTLVGSSVDRLSELPTGRVDFLSDSQSTQGH